MADPVPLFPPAEPPDPILRVEQGLLAAMISNPARTIAKLPPGFSSLHYVDAMHREVHDAIVASDANTADLLTVLLGLTGGDAAYVGALTIAFMGFGSVEPYAHAITESHHRRSVIAIAEKMLEDAKRSTVEMSAAKIMTEAVSQLDGMMSGTQHFNLGRSLDSAMDAAVLHAERAAKGDLIAGRSTGMPSVDDALGGLENATFNVLGARPGVGKTALAVQWAVTNARQCKVEGKGGVLGFSLEMSAKSLGRRVLAEAAGISVIDLKRGRIDEAQVVRLSKARHELAGLPIWLEDAGGQNLPAIRQKARSAQRRFGHLSLIWIDHIQIVKPDDIDRRHGGTQAVGRVSNALRDLCKEFDCPVLCLSQLSRGLLNRDEKRPNLGDLRQAGDIEQDADTVMFLHREEMFQSKSPPLKSVSETVSRHDAKLHEWRDAQAQCAGKAELILAKVRDGATCTVPLRWHGETTSFTEEASARQIPVQMNIDDYADRYYQGGPPGGF